MRFVTWQRVIRCALCDVCSPPSTPPAPPPPPTLLQRTVPPASLQDTDYTVRTSMCRQLSGISRAIGLDRAKAAVTKELFELLADEEKGVPSTRPTELGRQCVAPRASGRAVP